MATTEQDDYAERAALEFGRSAVERIKGSADVLVMTLLDDVVMRVERVDPDGNVVDGVTVAEACKVCGRPRDDVPVCDDCIARAE